MSRQMIRGAGGGGKGKGGKMRSAVEAPDTLRSIAYAKILDLIGEGEIEGLVSGLQSVYLDGTPVQNADGSMNFTGVTVGTANGTQSQAVLPGFEKTSSEIAVNVKVEFATPVVRTITNPDVDAARIRLVIPALTQQDITNGDLNGTSVQIALDVQSNGGGYVAQNISYAWMPSANPAVLTAIGLQIALRWTTTPSYPMGKNYTSWGACTFQVQYRQVGAGGWTTYKTDSLTTADLFAGRYFTRGAAYTSDRTYTITGLAELLYEVRVVQTGGSGSVSIVWFQTLRAVPYDTITGKATSSYQRSYRVELTGSPPWDIRMRRLTADSGSVSLQNSTYFDAYAEIIDEKFNYPNSALVGLSIDAGQFSSVPTRGYDMKLLRVKIPSNYNPVTRVYTGVWDGTFIVAWTDNPAWCFYDLLTSTRYGLGQYFPASHVDKWALYTIAQYCDGGVPDHLGHEEPRFTCNLYLQTRQEAFSVITQMASIFRGMAYWSAGAITAVQDAPSDPVFLFTEANVKDGLFTYSGSAKSVRHTVAMVSWADPDDGYTLKPEYVEDVAGIARYGVVPIAVTAVGCASRGQAHRVGEWLLYSERYETEVVTFQCGHDGTYLRPGLIFSVQDQHRAGLRYGGRAISFTSGSMTMDAAVTIDGAQTYSVQIVKLDGTLETKTINNAPGSTATLLFTNQSTATDLSGNGLHGTYQGSTAFAPGALAYDPDTASDFDGVDDSVLVADADALDVTTALTLEAWVYPVSFDHANGGNTPRIMSKAGRYQLYTNSTGTAMTLNLSLTTPNLVTESTFSLALDTWTHVAVTWDGANAQFYKNGWPIGSPHAMTGTLTANTEPLMLGDYRNDATERHWHGRLDELALWGVALTPSQIQTHWAAAAGTNTNKLPRSQEFDHAAWTKVGSSIVINATVAPDSTTTADTVVEDTSTGTHLAFQNNVPGMIAGGISTVSVYAKAAGRSIFMMYLQSGNLADQFRYEFNLGTEVVTQRTTTGTGSPISASITAVGNGWYRCVMTGVHSTTAADADVRILLCNAVNTVSYTGDGTSGLYLWGAQLELQATVGRYIPTTTAAKTLGTYDVEVLANTPVGYWRLNELYHPGAVWVLTSSALSPRLFRAISIAEVERQTYEVTGLLHNPSKFDYIERDLRLEQPATSVISAVPAVPHNVSISESLAIRQGLVTVIVEITWESVTNASFYRVEYRRDQGNYVALTEVHTSAAEIVGALPGLYEVTVRAGNALSNVGQPASASRQIFGKTARPANVEGFVVARNGESLLFSWSPVADLDLSYYELRFGIAWASGVPLGETFDTRFTVQTNIGGTYLIKAVDTSGNESLTAAAIIIDANTDINVVVTADDAPTWLGVHTQTAADPTGLTLAGQNTWSELTQPWSTYTDSWIQTGSPYATGTYVTVPIDLGVVMTSRVEILPTVAQEPIGLTWSDFTQPWSTYTDPWTGTPGMVSATYEMALSQDAISYSAWQTYQSGHYAARAYKFRITLATANQNYIPRMASFLVTVDVPDRVVHFEDQATVAGGTTLTFSPAFVNVQTVTGTIQAGAIGDTFRVTGKTNNQATVTVYDSAGTPKAGVVDIDVFGYGSI